VSGGRIEARRSETAARAEAALQAHIQAYPLIESISQERWQLEMSDYQKTEICEPIIAANRNHCYVPAEVWDVDAATVCGVCQAKNAGLISALMQKIPVATPQAVPVIVRTPVISIKALEGKYPKPLCQICGGVRLRSSDWDNGKRECSECKFKRGGYSKSVAN